MAVKPRSYMPHNSSHEHKSVRAEGICDTCPAVRRWTVDDPRLQAIADVWKRGDNVPLSFRDEKRYLRGEWPELTALLDALVEEPDEDS